MIGVILVSHGEMAKGVRNALSMFFGDNIEALEVVSLTPEKSSETFYEELGEARKKADRGGGVVIFADLFGGTPFNQSSRRLDSTCHIITGLNLSMIMEFLVLRECAKTLEAIPFGEILDSGRDGIRYIKEIEANEDSDEL